ncbi:hypothetical protein [Streptosporangium sandarakinum]|uniref:Lipoprotein n=1 Tax=Streptosporangium sandarakinum TaxID=1260955 RepID=A0A852V2C2_9ACTN|nr:hypothetical protein [Streptosporangium sandarakinum]NYF43902.1 hypothetical protein [Streptosporangium sandarakinum]
MQRFVVLMIALIVLSAGCTGKETMDHPAITKEKALGRVEQLIKEAISGVNPQPRLDLDQLSLTVDHCLDPTDGGSKDRIVVGRGYYLRDVPKDRLAEVSRQVRQTWEQRGHHVSGVSLDGIGFTGRSRPDDFLFSLLVADSDGGEVLNLGVSSPCIWPNGTPEPSTG